MTATAPARIGIVGAGVAGIRHLGRLAQREDVIISGVADASRSRQDHIAATYAIETFDSAESLIGSKPLDAVFICVPPDRHGPAEDACLAAALPMFIEKPIAVDVVTAERLAHRISASGIPVAVGYQWRQISFLPDLQDLISGRSVNLVVANWMAPPAPVRWWRDVRSSGGQFVEQTTHLVDLAIALNGQIESVSGCGSLQRLDNEPTGMHRASAAMARFANGSVGVFAATCALAEPYRRSLEILADELTAEITDEGGFCVTAASRHDWRHQLPDLYEREHAAFLALLREDPERGPIVGYQEALVSHRAACAMEDSTSGNSSLDRPV